MTTSARGPRSPVMFLVFVLLAAVAIPAARGERPGQGAEDAKKREDDLDDLLRRFGPEAEEMKDRILASIDKGVDWLLAKQADDGHWESYAQAYPIGGTALSALAVKKTMLGLYPGTATQLKSEIGKLEKKEAKGTIALGEARRLEYLRTRGSAEVELRARCQQSVEKAIAWIREKYKDMPKGVGGGTVVGGIGPIGPQKVYDVGVLLMLLEAYYTEKHEVKGESVAIMDPRRIGQADRKWVKELAEYLGSVVTKPTVGAKTFAGRAWRYPGGGDASVDNSNTQYAVLGLKAASRMGVHLDDNRIWRDVAEYFIACQEASGPEVQRKPPGVEQGTGRYVIPRQYATTQPIDRARGWSYLPEAGGTGAVNSFPVMGSMTTAGLAALVMATSELYEARVLPRDKDLEARIQKALADWMAWLGANFSVETNPTAGMGGVGGGLMRVMGGGPWHFYYLYGLERAGVLCQSEYFGEHAWYIEGAKYLLGRQGKDGSWSSQGGAVGGMAGSADGEAMVDTAFALLFLKRGTVPVNVPPVVEPVVTEGG